MKKEWKLTAEQKKLIAALHKTLKPRQFIFLERK